MSIFNFTSDHLLSDRSNKFPIFFSPSLIVVNILLPIAENLFSIVEHVRDKLYKL